MGRHRLLTRCNNNWREWPVNGGQTSVSLNSTEAFTGAAGCWLQGQAAYKTHCLTLTHLHSLHRHRKSTLRNDKTLNRDRFCLLNKTLSLTEQTSPSRTGRGTYFQTFLCKSSLNAFCCSIKTIWFWMDSANSLRDTYPLAHCCYWSEMSTRLDFCRCCEHAVYGPFPRSSIRADRNLTQEFSKGQRCAAVSRTFYYYSYLKKGLFWRLLIMWKKLDLKWGYIQTKPTLLM